MAIDMFHAVRIVWEQELKNELSECFFINFFGTLFLTSIDLYSPLHAKPTEINAFTHEFVASVRKV